MRILLVEDDRNVAETVRRTLVSQGWVVEVTGDGVSGLNSAVGSKFDVIVLDIMLPGLNGYEVVRRMRAAKVWTPVLMLTAKSGEYDLADALDLGADDYLTKPFSVVVLIARLRALARRGAPERPAVLSAGDLHLDPAAHTVHRGDTELGLTPREFAVLEDLMRHKGQVRSKADILASVWDAEVGGDDNLVEVYISYLRRRVDAPFGRKAIETVRGHGYRLAADGGAHTS
ncbi:MAG: response regulator transcription factor [Gordonia sp.]|jgi:two-component system OmpR family response regulator|uniref:response regulator transcription factor n=1 Tax=Gordonia sp. (in: high G+C Gram-positive bacteria) TaxID=84139 RepID=UPI001D5A0664|nr:response regulator transcription factor [Gordonia sp. (in: high G+C Gram-positive bacteria)]MCB1294367.1 response regulator transcription factor [Gordonia sp. (in: high G+C Gram-positive bacteria)]HQV21362.1 response regulator transcription factor [Gordonia sp. (in: high G+C Gram-positive bacteria)]